MAPEVSDTAGLADADLFGEIAARVAAVRERIASAERRANRPAGSVTLVAVSKRHGADAVRAVYAAGVRDVGENYVQEAQAKRAELDARAGALLGLRWHLIGALQSNKARAALETFDTIQTIDRWSLAVELGRRAVASGRSLDVLVEVRLDKGEGDSGRAGADFGDALALCDAVGQTDGLSLAGLMGLPPATPDAQKARPYFARLRMLFETLPAAQRRILSMGMSQDFEVAIEEGATLVRVGTALFGARQ